MTSAKLLNDSIFNKIKTNEIKVDFNVLINKLYYRIRDPNSIIKNRINKTDIHFQSSTLIEKETESVRNLVTGIEINDTIIENSLFYIRKSNIIKGKTTYIGDKFFYNELIFIKDVDGDLLSLNGMYSNNEYSGITVSQSSLKYACMSGTGKYLNAKYAIIHFINDKIDSNGDNYNPRIIEIYN